MNATPDEQDRSYTTCQYCTQRHPGCHTTCAGYQYREQKKPAEYARRLTIQRSVPEHRATKKAVERNERLRKQRHG